MKIAHCTKQLNLKEHYVVQRSTDVSSSLSTPYLNGSAKTDVNASNNNNNSNCNETSFVQIHAEAYNHNNNSLLADDDTCPHVNASTAHDETTRCALPSLKMTLVKVHAVIDLEFHQGTDGRFYMLDFARSFPPQDVTIQSQYVTRYYSLLYTHVTLASK